MAERERVGIAEMKIASDPDVLIAYGLGSCLGIAVYDPVQKIGGLVHSLLPSARFGASSVQRGKFVETAIAEMIASLIGQGSKKDDLAAKIAGGAQMFESIQTGPGSGIGARNIEMARNVLSEIGIPIVGESVGDSYGRTMEFDLSDGSVMVRSLKNREKSMENI